jgi:DNA invertase Pin-like site-specific DNA recombinase
MKTALYCRVSDDKLKDDGERRQDIERQVAKLKAWALATGEKINDEDVFRDDGISAFKDDYQSRPAFVKLLREIRGHHYQRVLVEDLTRWSRRLEDGLKTLRDVGDAGCTVTSLAESDVDVTTSSGWLKATLFLTMAEWASRIQSEKVKSGMAKRAKDQRCFCESCQTIHLGRHPKTCNCIKCLQARKKKG